MVPHQNLAITPQGADPHRQILQGLAVIAAQVIQVRRQPREVRFVILQLAFDQVDIFRGSAPIGLIGHQAIDHIIGYRRPHQP